tara:strand:+ start:95 stop:880 length:786 start_codon:yes stop_codon:yes gene_type:complete
MDTNSGNKPLLKTPEMRLDGKVALVTGASKGLGKACAFALAGAGARVFLLSRTLSTLKKVEKEIQKTGGLATSLACDVTDIAALREKIGSLQHIDILINNAGTNAPEPFIEVSEINFDLIMDLNVKAAVFVAQTIAKKMIEQRKGGTIINMSSQMGHVGLPGRTIYCASKHAIEGLTKAMGVELAPHNIRVNSISPTFIQTDMTASYLENEEARNDTLSRIPLGQLGELEDIMGAIVFLASPASALITGTSIAIDGGWTAW